MANLSENASLISVRRAAAVGNRRSWNGFSVWERCVWCLGRLLGSGILLGPGRCPCRGQRLDRDPPS
eukprot:273981-Lingulodinium_polyedra.AAC.1